MFPVYYQKFISCLRFDGIFQQSFSGNLSSFYNYRITFIKTMRNEQSYGYDSRSNRKINLNENHPEKVNEIPKAKIVPLNWFHKCWTKVVKLFIYK
jgi:hypothetical protein